MAIVYNLFEQEISRINTIQPKNDATSFFIQECLRFYSISRTLINSNIDLSINCCPETRYITHPLARSLLENFFAITYIFDKPNNVSKRYKKLKNSFKEEYRKLINELQIAPWDKIVTTNNWSLEPYNPIWNTSEKLPNVREMLKSVRNAYGDKLDYLYVIYRITSFDTHGRSLETIFSTVFGKKCNFPVLNLNSVFEIIASEYLVILKKIRLQSLKSANNKSVKLTKII